MKICASREGEENLKNTDVQLINSFTRYVLNAYWVLGIVLELTTVHKMDKILALMRAIF